MTSVLIGAAVLAALALAPVSATPHYWFEQPTAAVEVTPDSMGTTLGASKLVLLQLYSPQCLECGTGLKEWEAAVALAKVSTPDLTLARVDTEAHPDVKDLFGVTALPTYILFSEGKQVATLAGQPLTAEALVAQARLAAGLPASTFVHPLTTRSDADSWLFDRARPTFTFLSTLVAFVPAGLASGAEAPVVAAMEAVAPNLATKMRFAVVTGEDVIEGYGMPANAVSLALYKNYDEGKEVYTGALADLPAWLLARSEPAVRAMEWHDVLDTDSKAFVACVFFNDYSAEHPGHKAVLLKQLRQASSSLESAALVQRGQYTIALVAAGRHPSLLQSFNLSPASLPAMGVLEGAGERHFVRPAGPQPLGTLGSEDTLPTLSAGEVATFVKAYLAGGVKSLEQ